MYSQSKTLCLANEFLKEPSGIPHPDTLISSRHSGSAIRTALRLSGSDSYR